MACHQLLRCQLLLFPVTVSTQWCQMLQFRNPEITAMIMRLVFVLHQLLQPAAQLFLAALLLLHRELRAAASHA
jgi:hypothetical protein